MLRGGLERANDIEVVGSASNAREAIELCNTLWPDILTLDLELPDLDGVRVLQHIRDMPVRVLVVSAFTTGSQSERAVEALAEGAIDCLGKPNLGATPSVFIAELLERVRDIAAGAPYIASSIISSPHVPHGKSDRLFVVGASTGGPRALNALLPALPEDFPAPIVVVQHIPTNFSAPFARRLDRYTSLRCREAYDGAPLEAGTIYVAAAGKHLHIDGGTIGVRDGHRVNGLIPSIDVTLIDAAASWGSRVTGIILTGIGSDGREGSRAVKGVGGRIIAENENTCAVYGMPRAVVDAGLADEIAPLDTIAQLMIDEVA